MTADRDLPSPSGLLRRLVDAGALIETAARGLYGSGALIDRLAASISRLVMAHGADERAEIMRFPPLIPRAEFEASGYFRNFADLVGTVHCFHGDEEDHRRLVRAHDEGGDWTTHQAASDLVLLPAACYPVYPVLARRGPVAAIGAIVDVCSHCFRREPSDDPARMQMFRQHERVFVGTPEEAVAFRARWSEHAQAIATALALPHALEVANDPFYGRLGRVMARGQREAALKLEISVPIASDTAPTACISLNLHLAKMADAFGLRLSDGTGPHTACVGFGLERLALAVLRHHGTDEAAWPDPLRATLAADPAPAPP